MWCLQMNSRSKWESNEKEKKKTDTDRKDNSNSEGQKDRRRGEVKNWERKMREIRIKKRMKKWEKDGWGTSEKGQHS